MKHLIILSALFFFIGCGGKKKEPEAIQSKTNTIRVLDSSGNVITVTTSGGESEVTINGEKFSTWITDGSDGGHGDVLIPTERVRISICDSGSATGVAFSSPTIDIDTVFIPSQMQIHNYYHIYFEETGISYNFLPQSYFPFIRISTKPFVLRRDSLLHDWGRWGNFMPGGKHDTGYVKAKK